MQRHFRVVFFVLLAVLIVSFVFTIGAAPGIGSGDRQIQARTYFDINLSSPEGQALLNQDASLSIMLQSGFQNFSNAQIQEFALERYAALYLAKQLNLPGPSAEQYEAFVREVRAFIGPTGEFDASVYARFRDNLRLANQFTEADVARVLRDDYKVRQVQELLGGPGYVADAEVEFQLARTDTVWSVDVIELSYDTFAPTIEPTEDELRTFFDANSFRYDTAPQVRVNYVEFPATRYLAQIQLSEEEIRAHYDANPARFPRPTSGDEDTPALGTSDPDIDYLAVRDQVSAALRFERARRLAAEAASDLTVAIFDAQVEHANLPTFISSQGYSLRSGAAFDRANPPAFLNTSPQLVMEAFRLDEDDRVSDPLPTAAGAVVLVWEESIDSMPSPFENVIDRVRVDYLESEKRERFVELGRRIQSDIESAVAAGANVEDAVTALTDLDGATASVSSYADFTRMAPPPGFPPAASSSLEGLDVGQVSDMVLLADQGLLTHASARTAPNLGAADPRYGEIREQLAQINAASTASGVMREIIATELENSESIAN